MAYKAEGEWEEVLTQTYGSSQERVESYSLPPNITSKSGSRHTLVYYNTDVLVEGKRDRLVKGQGTAFQNKLLCVT